MTPFHRFSHDGQPFRPFVVTQRGCHDTLADNTSLASALLFCSLSDERLWLIDVAVMTIADPARLTSHMQPPGELQHVLQAACGGDLQASS